MGFCVVTVFALVETPGSAPRPPHALLMVGHEHSWGKYTHKNPQIKPSNRLCPELGVKALPKICVSPLSWTLIVACSGSCLFLLVVTW